MLSFRLLAQFALANSAVATWQGVVGLHGQDEIEGGGAHCGGRRDRWIADVDGRKARLVMELPWLWIYGCTIVVEYVVAPCDRDIHRTGAVLVVPQEVVILDRDSALHQPGAAFVGV